MWEWILNGIGTAFGYILYPLMIQAPLQILNAIYRVFTFCCGADIGKMFFNSNIQNIQLDTNTIVWDFLMKAGIVAIMLIFMFLCVLTVEHLITRKKIDFLSKVKWPLMAMTSTITIPIAFIMLSGVSSLFMELLGGTSAKIAILEQNISEIGTRIKSGLEELKDSFGIHVDIEGTKITVSEGIEKLKEALQNLATKAKEQGLTDYFNKINNTIDNLTKLQPQITYLLDDKNGIIKDFKDIIQYMKDHTKNGEVIADAEWSNKLNNLIANLTNIRDEWNTVITDINDYCQKYQVYIPDIGKITIQGVEIDGWNFLKTIQNDNWKPFSVYWINSNKDSLLTVMLKGGEWNKLNFDKNIQCCLETLNTGLNPESRYTFDLVIQIYRAVTGNTDSNWTGAWNMSKPINFLNVGVGFIMIAMTIWVVGLFSINAAKRFTELIVLAIFAVITASWGIKDDGVKFKNNVKLIIGKMFSVTIAYGAFTIAVQLVGTITGFIYKSPDFMPTNSLTASVVEILLTVGGLLGAYAIANTISTWVGDSASLKETMADIGAITTGMRAGAMVGKLTYKAAKGSVKGVGLTMKKTGLMSTPIQRQNKAWAFAEKQGLGKVVSGIDKDGKAFKTFKFSESASNVAESAKAYNDIMNSFNKKKFSEVSDKKQAKLASSVKDLGLDQAGSKGVE